MRFYPGDPDHQPIRHIGRVPVFAATILAALFFIGMLVTEAWRTAGGSLDYFIFSTEAFFLRGWLWQFVTCTLVNYADFFFVFYVFFFYRFSVEIETYAGRRAFLKLYALMVLAIIGVAGVWRLFGVAGGYFGMSLPTMGLFIAYATLYPELEALGWLPYKYVAAACLTVSAISYFPNHAWYELSQLLGVCGVGFVFMRYVKNGGSVEFPDVLRKLNPFHKRSRFRVLPSVGPGPKRASGFGSVESVDPILDKIAQKGFASLTQAERDQLEKAREILNKKRQ